MNASGELVAFERAHYEQVASAFRDLGRWRVTHVEPTGMSHIEDVTAGQLATVALDALSGNRRYSVMLWLCSGCDMLFSTDDLTQVQPDGHDACPVCENDHSLAEVQCEVLVVNPPANDRSAESPGVEGE